MLHQSKLDLALGLLDQALGWKSWRAALRERHLFYAAARTLDNHRLAGRTTLWTPCARVPGLLGAAWAVTQPEPKTSLAIAPSLPATAWKKVTWRQGTKGPQRSRFATSSLWAAHGWKQGPQPERIEKIALIEWPEGEPAPTHYWLARLPKGKVASAKLVATAKARWRVEQDCRELKDELGLDHFEGRSW